jgi:hypothetical protein
MRRARVQGDEGVDHTLGRANELPVSTHAPDS